MANKRMFSKDITDSDAFIAMSSAAQALYFHLNQGADDDGLTNQIQLAMLKAHASADDLKLLLAKKFLIYFPSGVIAIRHWRLHNTLRHDRYKPSIFQEELQQLGCQAVANGLPDGCRRLEEDRLGKDRLEEDRLEEVRLGEDRLEEASAQPLQRPRAFRPPSVEEVAQYCRGRGNCVDPQGFVDHYTSNGWMVGRSKMKDWKAAVRTWERREPARAPGRAKGGNVFLEIAREEGIV